MMQKKISESCKTTTNQLGKHTGNWDKLVNRKYCTNYKHRYMSKTICITIKVDIINNVCLDFLMYTCDKQPDVPCCILQ